VFVLVFASLVFAPLVRVLVRLDADRAAGWILEKTPIATSLRDDSDGREVMDAS